MGSFELPSGFSTSVFNVGGTRLALIESTPSASAWVLGTENRAAAPSVVRGRKLVRGGHSVGAVVVTPGIANALCAESEERDLRLATLVARLTGRSPSEVLTAGTGVLGVDLPIEALERAASSIRESEVSGARAFARAICSGDGLPKWARRTISIDGTERSIVVIAKGSRRVAPELATLLVFVMTDAALTREALRGALEFASETSLQQLSIDGEPSTNDLVVALANGQGEPIHPQDPEARVFFGALKEAFDEISIQVAREAAGRLRALVVEVEGAQAFANARAIALSLAASRSVGASLRQAHAGVALISSLGAASAMIDEALDVSLVEVRVSGRVVFAGGGPRGRPPRAQGDEVVVSVRLGDGPGRGRALGIELLRETSSRRK
ncbi:MAG: bifunctional ornithine acetyltransferase/N-acetylglutamate synthase [Deltaproteobacteria bacterium]|nr:bifunctional ornithine acetyltransferase/N-acetylglutamate synthase [Deltaproteobacteria bacterium]